MGHCVRIYFDCPEKKEAAFRDLKSSSHVETISADTLRFIDPSSNSDNFISNNENFLEIEIEVKTRLLSQFMLSQLGQYQCALKDCEDSEEEHYEPLSTFFRV